jgi:chromosome segregation ATPase
MAGTKGALRTMRMGVLAFALLLIVGAIACYAISSKAVASARSDATLEAKGVADSLVNGILTPEDLTATVTLERAKEIDDALRDGRFDSTGFDTVTVWSGDGTAVYSSDRNRLGDQVPAEVSHLKAVIDDGASSRVVEDVFSAYAPLANGAVVEFDRPYGPIAATGRPMHLAAGLFALLFVGTIYIMFRLSRSIASSAANAAFRPTPGLGHVSQAPQEIGRAKRGEEAQLAMTGFREEAEARRRAEDRATALEEQVALLQEQYRNSLGELQATQRKLQDSVTTAAPAQRPDARLEERVLRAEGQARLLEAQLSATTAERDKLSADLIEAQKIGAEAAAARSDPDVERRLQRFEQESIALRAELEGTRTELEVAKRELATQQTRGNDLAVEIESAKRTASDAEVVRGEVERLRIVEREADQMRAELETLRPDAELAARLAKDLDLSTAARQESERSLEASRAEALAATTALEEVRAELAELQSSGETRTTALDEELRAARASVEQLESELEAARAGLGAELETVKAELGAELESAQAELARVSEELASTRATHGATSEELEAARAELETGRSEAASTQSELSSIQGQLEVTLEEHATLRAGLTASQSQLESTLTDLGSARAETQSARADADAVRAELDALRSRHADELAAKELELEQRVAEHRAGLQSELDAIELDLKAKLDATVAELREEITDAESRTALAEGQVQAAKAEAEDRDRAIRSVEQELAAANAELDALRSGMSGAQQDAASIRAELERSKTELESSRQNAEQAETELRATKIAAASAQEDLEVSRQASSQALAELQAVRDQLAAAEAARTELDGVAAALAAANDELNALRSEKSDEENELARVQAESQATRREAEAAQERVSALTAELEGARAEIAAREAEVASAQARLTDVEAEAGGAHDEATRWQTRLSDLQGELDVARAELLTAQAEIQTELTRGVEITARAEQAEQELAMLRDQQMATAAAGAEQEGLQEALRVNQERLAAQADKLNDAEERAHAAERQLHETLAKLEHAEHEARRAVLERAQSTAEGEALPPTVGDPLEDRRGASPFVKELSLDAKKSLTQILGLTLTLKHKKSAQEQAPFLRQLSAMVKRLDRTVSDLSEADKLARGEIELSNRRTNLEALVERVVEESGVGADHDVRVDTEELVVALDPLRTEQILNGLLRTSADRTSPGSQIAVRLSGQDGGALISVEDKEPSSDGSMSPVVVRLATVMGGWATVESRPNGGSSFRVFIPDANGPRPEDAEPKPTAEDDAEETLQITVKSPQAEPDKKPEKTEEELDLENDPWAAGQLLMQELQRLSHQEDR